MVSFEIERLNACGYFPSTSLLIRVNKAKIVVVLTPPPVPPGEAPINIKTFIKRIEQICASYKLKVVNPAVLVETLKKNDSKKSIPAGTVGSIK